MPRTSSASVPPPSVAMRDLTAEDLPAVIEQQVAAFPTNVWSRFGGRLLQTYLRLFLESPYAVAITPVLDGSAPGTPVGHLLGILDTGAHRRWIRRHGVVRLALALPAAILRHPWLAGGLIRRRLGVRLRRLRSTSVAQPDEAHQYPASVAVLSHVMVRPEHRGQGLGEALVDAFLGDATGAGAGYACLATLDGDGAGPWYEARGWTPEIDRKTFDGRWIRIYRYPL